MATVTGTERAALLDLFAETGPDAPTLCEGWTTYDLAAHLVARERRPLAGPGLVVPLLHPLTAFFERRERQRPYKELIRLLRSGPPLLSVGQFDGVELGEWYVHHEDVRRVVRPGPRDAGAELQEALWKRLAAMGLMLTMPARGLGVVLSTPDGRFRRVRLGAGEVELHGTPAELVMWLFGRRAAASAELTGDLQSLQRAREVWPTA